MPLGDGAALEGARPEREGIGVIVIGKLHEEHAVGVRFDIDLDKMGRHSVLGESGEAGLGGSRS